MNYHYTTLLHLPHILVKGWLHPSRADAHGQHAGGLLWFSRNEVLERSAYKADVPMVRFSSTRAGVLPWKLAAAQVGFTAGQMRRLEKSGRAMGASPSEWYALVGGLSLAMIDSLELRWQGQWQMVSPDGLEVVTEDTGALTLHSPAGVVISSARLEILGQRGTGYRAVRASLNAQALLYDVETTEVGNAAAADVR